jgi:sugar lactone lactonase YvrE
MVGRAQLLLIWLLFPLVLPAARAQDIITNYAGGGPIGGAALTSLVTDPSGLARDVAGNLYIATVRGNTVLKLDANGIISGYAGTGVGGYAGDGGPATSAQLSIPLGISLDRQGNLFIADNVNSVIRRVDAVTRIITTVAGNGSPGYAGDNGPATSAALNSPSGVAVDGLGNLFIADEQNHVIRRVVAATGIISTVAGDHLQGGGFAGDGGPATSAALNNPRAVALDNAGNLFIADTNNSCVRRVDAVTRTISTVAGQGQVAGDGGDGTPATAAMLTLPAQVFVDWSGNLLIADQQRIRRVEAVTQFITTVAGSASRGFSGDGGPATSAEIDFPAGIASDATGNIYFSDGHNNRVRFVSSKGMIKTLAGGGSGGDGGPASTAVLSGSVGLATDSLGNLFIGDFSVGRVRKVDASSGNISTTAGNGIRDTAGNGGPATSAEIGFLLFVATDHSGNLFLVDGTALRRVDASTGVIAQVIAPELSSTPPNGIATNAAGFVYLSDSARNVVVRLDPATGASTVVAGTAGLLGYSGDGGPAISSAMNLPAGLALDSAGNLFIADQLNNVVRRVDAATGIMTTIAGTGTPGFSGDGGPATGATLSLPFALAFDPYGNLFIGEGRNKRIRRVSARTGFISTVAGNGSSSLSGDEEDALLAGIGSPFALATDSHNHLFVSNPDIDRVRQILLTPVADPSLASLAFPSTRVRVSSVPQSIVFTNAGNGAMTIAGISATGDFSQTNTCAGLLPPGMSCDISVTFAPLAPGARTGSITIADNAGVGSQVVDLLGTATAAEFTFAPPNGDSTTISIAPGDSAIFTLVLHPDPGFTGSISLTCPTTIPFTSCAIRPAVVNVTASPGPPTTVTVTLLTNRAAKLIAPRMPYTWLQSEPLGPLPLGALAAWVLLIVTLPRCLPRQAMRLAQALMLLVLVITWTGCTNNDRITTSGSPTTPAGAYQLPVVATGPGGVQRIVTLTIHLL